MKKTISKVASIAVIGTLGIPLFAFAQSVDQVSTLSQYTTIISYITLLAFLVATIILGTTIHKFGSSTLGSVFYYLFIGTGIFVFMSLFFGLGADFFGISKASLDVWLHLMIYMAFISYFYGSYLLVSLGDSDAVANKPITKDQGRKWSLLAAIILLLIFSFPRSFESGINVYMSSAFNAVGLHHFIAFALAGLVAMYLARAEKKLGQIGKAIANPIIFAVTALSLQHLWLLLSESWKVIAVSAEVGEGIEKTLLLVASLAVCYGMWRLKKFTTV